MSFILDALRKSEHERQRQAGPTVAELPIARPASRTRTALLAVGALLVVNLGVVLYFLLRTPSPPVREAASPPAQPARSVEPAPVAPPAVEPIRPPDEAGTRPAPPPSAVRPLAEEAAAEPGPAPTRAAPAAPDPSLLPAAPRPAAAAQPRPASAPDEFIPRLDSLPPEATAGLPRLSLDLHIYATDPAQRAVFINGHRYREGDIVPGGAKIEAITTEGAVLRYKGQRFLLPRQ